MKQLIFIIILIPLCSNAQKSFAPLGAVWNYERGSQWLSSILGCEGNHLQYIVEEEVMIEGKDCSLIRAYHSTNLDAEWSFPGDSLIVYEEGGQVYFQQDDTFLLLFDFDAEVGDTIIKYDPYKRGLFSGTYYEDSDTTANRKVMIVYDVQDVEVEGVILKKQIIRNLDPHYEVEGDEILQGVGSLSHSFSGDYFSYLANGCDGGFVCYMDEQLDYNLGINSSNPYPGCDFLDRVDDNLPLEISSFPNPFPLY